MIDYKYLPLRDYLIIVARKGKVGRIIVFVMNFLRLHHIVCKMK